MFKNNNPQDRPTGFPSLARSVFPLVVSSFLLSGCLTTTGLEGSGGGVEPSDLKTLQPAEKLDPDYRTLLLAHGQRALESGKYEEATSAYKRVLDAEPQNADAAFGMAETMLATGNNTGALGYYRTIKQDEAYLARAMQGEGIVLLRFGQGQQSSELLHKAVALDPSLWRAWNALGRTLDMQGKHDAARESYDRALALAPNSAVILNNRGVSNILAGRYAEAEENLRQASASDRKIQRARANLRLALAWQGKYEEALAGVSRVDAPIALNNIGYIAMKRGDLGHAEAYFAQAMQLSPAFYDKADRNLKFLRDMRKLNGSDSAVKS